MQVILQEDVEKLGKAGEVVSVREGYGRNFLLPQGKAVPADPGNLRKLEHQRRVIQAAQQKARKGAEDFAERLKGVSLTIGREAGEEDRLFGSVTAKDIAEALRAEGLTVDRHSIQMEAPIRQLGIFDVPVKLHPEVAAAVKVWVVKR